MKEKLKQINLETFMALGFFGVAMFIAVTQGNNTLEYWGNVILGFTMMAAGSVVYAISKVMIVVEEINDKIDKMRGI